MGVLKTNDSIQIKIKLTNPSQETPASSKTSNEDIKDMDDLCDFIQIKIKMPNPSQEPPASFKATNQYRKDVDVLFTLKTKIESQNLEYVSTKDQ